jgi:hypothetical protein
MFTDVFEPGQMIPLSHVGNIPHRVMAFEIATAEARWTAAKHPLLKFVRQTNHPDIQIGELRTRHKIKPVLPQRASAAGRMMGFAAA